MVRLRPAGIPLGLLAATSLLALVFIHTVGYAVGHAVGDRYAVEMTTTQHDAYWPAFVTAVVGIALASAVAARSRTRFARGLGGDVGLGRVRLAVRVWLTLAAASLAGFVVLENLEGILIEHELVGLAPLLLLGRLAALGPVAIGITGLALGAVAIVVVGRVEYASVLTRSYADLVAGGVYTAEFRQSPWAVDFVTRVVGDALADRDPATPIRILEAGCGTGVWLEEVASLVASRPAAVGLYGFDLSPDMAAAARMRLDRAGVTADVRQGDILDAAAYRFDDDDGYDLVFAYDVVQQLPADIQQAAVDSMLAHVRRGGRLVVFDHDARSRYGRVMGARKWLRRYLGIPLVPRHYIHARYPSLEEIRRRMAARGFDARITVETDLRKRALVIDAAD